MRAEGLLHRKARAQILVHGGARDAEHLGDVGRRYALVPQASSLGSIGVLHLAGPTPFASVGSSRRQSGAGALDHRVALELSEGRHDRQHRFAHRTVGVHALGDAAEADATGGELFDHGEDVLGVAPEPVELPDGEDVAFT